MLRSGEIDEIVERIVSRVNPYAVVMFGSYAKGVATLTSDLDLMIIRETELPASKRADDIRSLFAAALIPVDLHVYTPEEVEEYGAEPFAFVRSVLSSGRVMYLRPGAKWPLSAPQPA